MRVERRDVLRALAFAPVAWQSRLVERAASVVPIRSDGDSTLPTGSGGDPATLPDRLTGLRPASVSGRFTLTEPVQLAAPFSMLGVGAPPGAEIHVRTGSQPGHLGDWTRVRSLLAEGEGPDGDEDAAADGWRRMSEPLWTGPATVLQVAVAGAEAEEVEVALIPAEDPAPGAGDGLALASHDGPRVMTTAAAAGGLTPAAGTSRALDVEVGDGWPPAPPAPSLMDEPEVLRTVGGLRVVSRREWGANESWRGEPSYASRVRHGVVHHTVNSNSYSRSQGAELVRGIYRYHTRTLGWSDIGYNVLVDRYGVIYEGRFGGLDRPVIGAHARGANAGSFGVAVIGDFRSVAPPHAARSALLQLLVAKFNLHAIDPGARVTANGRRVWSLSGHRDVGSTACPGGALYQRLPGFRGELGRRVTLRFTDIAGHPHEKSIERLRNAGVTSGYPDGTYRPDEPVDRGQMATFVTRAARLRPGSGHSYRDVSRSHSHFDGIMAVTAAGIAQGYDDGTYRPSREVTRGQMATFLARALGLPQRVGLTFRDVLPTHPHYGWIEAAAHAGIARGYSDGTYRPGRSVTRGEMAAFLVRAFLQ